MSKPPRELDRRKQAAVVKLARGGMGARQIAKRVGERVEVVRKFIQTLEEETWKKQAAPPAAPPGRSRNS